MARNGSGVYSLPGTYLAVSGETIEAQQHNDPLEDLEADANNARPIVAGGTGASSASDARDNLGVTSAISSAVAALIPSGTAMLFAQTAAPTGWTKQTTHNDKALRVVSGTAGSGGSTAFTTVFAARTITQGNIPNYNLTATGLAVSGSISVNNSGDAGGPYKLGKGTVVYSPGASNQAYIVDSPPSVSFSLSAAGNIPSGGSGGAMDFAVAYVDVIIATKD